jgi:hypothetical protein
MTVSTIKARAMRLSFGLEDGDCKGFWNINKVLFVGNTGVKYSKLNC